MGKELAVVGSGQMVLSMQWRRRVTRCKAGFGRSRLEAGAYGIAIRAYIQGRAGEHRHAFSQNGSKIPAQIRKMRRPCTPRCEVSAINGEPSKNLFWSQSADDRVYFKDVIDPIMRLRRRDFVGLLQHSEIF